MRQTQTQLAGARHAITSVTVGDGIGSGAGTVIMKEGKSLLEIWREDEVQKIPLTLAAAAPALLKALLLFVGGTLEAHSERGMVARTAIAKAGINI